MKAIQIIVNHMDDTLDEANEYYKDYIIYKDEHPMLASTALDMAKTHLELYSKWHIVVTNMINEYKKTKGEPPETMKSLWNYKHEKLMEDYDKLKFKIMSV